MTEVQWFLVIVGGIVALLVISGWLTLRIGESAGWNEAAPRAEALEARAVLAELEASCLRTEWEHSLIGHFNNGDRNHEALYAVVLHPGGWKSDGPMKFCVGTGSLRLNFFSDYDGRVQNPYSVHGTRDAAEAALKSEIEKEIARWEAEQASSVTSGEPQASAESASDEVPGIKVDADGVVTIMAGTLKAGDVIHIEKNTRIVRPPSADGAQALPDGRATC